MIEIIGDKTQMFKLLIDTMPIYELLTEQEKGDYFKLAEKIQDQKITGVISAVTLSELISHLGKDLYRQKIKELFSTKLIIVEVSHGIAIRAGELHMNQKLPLGDALIAATGITENIKHVLTEDGHFDSQNFIKPINLKTALKLGR
ncbi:MAG: PIN domain-containing protein [Candidatus Methanoperedens sp.]|nr:PIN domain-containing protein [Candidatus Methanoperedens sp.]